MGVIRSQYNVLCISVDTQTLGVSISKEIYFCQNINNDQLQNQIVIKVHLQQYLIYKNINTSIIDVLINE